MAVIKEVSSKAGIGTAIDYVTKEEKIEQTLLSGLNCEPETAKEEMQATKELWGKTDGRTYKHFVQSFAPDEKIDPVQAHQLACRLAAERPEWKGFEVLIATHKDREHIHTHFIVNSVSFEDGHKLQQSKADLQSMKNCSDRLCLEYGLHITEKGKIFARRGREETTAFKKDTYQILKKAEKGEVKSHVQDIAPWQSWTAGKPQLAGKISAGLSAALVPLCWAVCSGALRSCWTSTKRIMRIHRALLYLSFPLL